MLGFLFGFSRSFLRNPFRTRVLYASAALGFIALGAVTRADASVIVNIDRPSQRMSVTVDGMPRYNWRVLDGARRLCHAAWHLSSANAGAALVFKEIL